MKYDIEEELELVKNFNKQYNIKTSNELILKFPKEIIGLTKERKAFLEQIPIFGNDLKNFCEEDFYIKIFSIEGLRDELNELFKEIDKDIIVGLKKDLFKIQQSLAKNDYDATIENTAECLVHLITGLKQCWDHMERTPSKNMIGLRNVFFILSCYLFPTIGPTIKLIDKISSLSLALAKNESVAKAFGSVMGIQSLDKITAIPSSLLKGDVEAVNEGVSAVISNIQFKFLAEHPDLRRLMDSYNRVVAITGNISPIADLKLNSQKVEALSNELTKDDNNAVFFKNLISYQNKFRNSEYPEQLKTILDLSPRGSSLEKSIIDINLSSDSSLAKLIKIHSVIEKHSEIITRGLIGSGQNDVKKVIENSINILISNFNNDIIVPLKNNRELSNALNSNNLVKNTNLYKSPKMPQLFR